MSVVGINDETQLEILKLVSAVLHIGNITFMEENNYAAVDNPDSRFSPTLVLRFKLIRIRTTLYDRIFESERLM